MSVSIENFLKTIYNLEQGIGKDTKPGTIAYALGITNAATTDMARKLATRKLINYKKYQKLTLTPTGQKMALSIIRKHRLWESFLYKTFNLSFNEIHREAEMLEHQTSDFLADKISKYLDYPKFDPHGDPIPNSEGTIETDDHGLLLSNANPGENYFISRIYNSDDEIFEFCEANNLSVGSSIKVEKQFEKTHMTEVSIESKKLILNKDFTNIIYLKK